MDKSQKRFHLVVNALLFLAGVTALSAGGYLTFQLQAATAATFYGTGLILLFASTIDRFESLKGFGMEAKQRELNRTLTEVQEVLEEVQRLSVFTTQSLATLYGKTGRFNGAPSAEEMYAIVTACKSSMKRAQATDAAIKAALHPCVKAMLIDLNYAVIHPALSALRIREQELSAELHATPVSDLETRQEKLKAWQEMGQAASAVVDFTDFEEGSYPWKMIDTLRSTPAKSIPEAETAAQLLATFSADIQNLQRRGMIDDPSAWFTVTQKAT
ncbi:hypothetical protein [Stenotrophomonas maltophilia]|uniref:hypothetical protein n=2 Tax=Stenotrophomonas maltophilia TaxID=40324 RepID=UPI0012AF8079|nr:hypothetical protein [Stenotrophomonas maltophilia]QGL75702.1 hypothetical protein FEO95_08715 [Stenotrophomonas maltophilia]